MAEIAFLIKRSFAALALLAIPSFAFAQARVSAQSPDLTVSIEGPRWIGDAKNTLETGADPSGNIGVFSEFIPEGQSTDSWQEMFGIAIEENATLNIDQ